MRLAGCVVILLSIVSAAGCKKDEAPLAPADMSPYYGYLVLRAIDTTGIDHPFLVGVDGQASVTFSSQGGPVSFKVSPPPERHTLAASLISSDMRFINDGLSLSCYDDFECTMIEVELGSAVTTVVSYTSNLCDTHDGYHVTCHAMY